MPGENSTLGATFWIIFVQINHPLFTYSTVQIPS